MHYFKRNIGDYHKKAGRLTMLQHGAYTLLMDACYDRERFPTMEEAIEWIWASSKEEIEAVEFVLKRFFSEQDGVFVQERIEEEIARYHKQADTNKRIAIERETKRREKRTKRACIVDESDTNEHEAPPNQEPLTNNQEPKKKKGGKPPVPFAQIQEAYNEALPTLTGCRVMSKKTEDNIRKIWNADERHQDVDFFRRYFSALNKLPHRMRHWEGVETGNKCGNIELLTREETFVRSVNELLELKG